MALTNEQITAKNFKKFYEAILPYLNGEAHASFTPVGSIIAIMGNEAPQNFLACDGTAYNIADYLELATYFNQQFGSTNYFGGDGTTTFAVPDLRGEFLRGTGTNSHTNQGSGANVGVHQNATEHLNMIRTNQTRVNLYGDANEATIYRDSDIGETTKGSKYTAETYVASVNTAIKYTARPTNTSVLYCIATKNVFSDISDSLEPGEGIVIEDNEISVDTMTAEDLQDVKDAFMPNTGAPMRMFNYSTDEQVVGKWIDGKPLYQKTIDFGALPNNTRKRIAHGISNFGKLISLYGTLDSGNLQSVIMFSFPDDITYNVGAYIDGAELVIRTGTDRTSDTSYVTILYTKTTD